MGFDALAIAPVALRQVGDGAQMLAAVGQS
jgi:hypothetical protein